MATSNPPVKQHHLVASIIPDPNVVPNVVVMRGYVGRSPRDGFLRLYDSLRFDSFVELPVDGVVHREDPDEESAPLDGALLWVKADAQLTSVVSSGVGKAAAFLTGNISARNMGQRNEALRGAMRPIERTPPQHPPGLVMTVDVCPPQATANCPGTSDI